jgi:hypothetical protein
MGSRYRPQPSGRRERQADFAHEEVNITCHPKQPPPSCQLDILVLARCASPARGLGPPTNESEAIALLRRVVDKGVTFIDTADSYGPGISEMLIAKALYPYPAGPPSRRTAVQRRRGSNHTNIRISTRTKVTRAAPAVRSRRATIGARHHNRRYRLAPARTQASSQHLSVSSNSR